MDNFTNCFADTTGALFVPKAHQVLVLIVRGSIPWTCHVSGQNHSRSNIVKVVLSWEQLTKTTKIKCFLGLIGFYRRFIQGFSSIAAPLTRLNK